MSLRSFHIVFILASLGVLGFLAYGSGHRVQGGLDGQNLALLVCAVAGLAAGVLYLFWFIRKKKGLATPY
ncbi:MAG: hypothetical protein HY551_01380 [Elusimicrobia bacterium]|nr:hypothetical protein [Elusimicrobiota bacterium]